MKLRSIFVCVFATAHAREATRSIPKPHVKHGWGGELDSSDLTLWVRAPSDGPLQLVDQLVLGSFCEEHRLDETAMRAVARGEAADHDGWTCGKAGRFRPKPKPEAATLPMAYIHGRMMPLSEAALPITDWGVIHSDVCYDVAPVWEGGFFRLRDYIRRFLASAAALRLEVGMEAEDIESLLCTLLGQSNLRQAYVALVVSRGTPLVAGSRDPRHCANHFYAWCVPYVHVIRPEAVEGGGATAWISKTVRRTPRASFDPRVKNYQWGDFTMGLIEAKERGHETVILLDAEGFVTEGPGFNVFGVTAAGHVVTPEAGMLEGITRRTVLEICSELGLQAECRPLPVGELLSCAEVFISTTAGGVIPLTAINDTPVGSGAVGPMSSVIRERYWEWVRRPHMRTEIQYG